MTKDPDQLSEASFFHYITICMGILLLGIAGWIGVNVAEIPVIQSQMSTLSENIRTYVARLDGIDNRVRVLEIKSGSARK